MKLIITISSELIIALNTLTVFLSTEYRPWEPIAHTHTPKIGQLHPPDASVLD
jgi:hypothetical protein